MGNSAYQGKEWTAAFAMFHKNEIKSALDIGPGQGTYYHLLNSILKDCKWTGVEVFKPYIDKFNLNDYYDHIYNEDIRSFDTTDKYDLIIAGDVLEHMTKEEAVSLVEKLRPLCKYFLISIPIVHWPQEAINDNPFEVHVKDDWSNDEIMDTFNNILHGFAGSHIGVYVLAGGIGSTNER